MVNDMTAVVAAASPNRGIGYQGQMVRCRYYWNNHLFGLLYMYHISGMYLTC